MVPAVATTANGAAPCSRSRRIRCSSALTSITPRPDTRIETTSSAAIPATIAARATEKCAASDVYSRSPDCAGPPVACTLASTIACSVAKVPPGRNMPSAPAIPKRRANARTSSSSHAVIAGD